MENRHISLIMKHKYNTEAFLQKIKESRSPAMEDQLLRIHVLEAINLIKNVSKKRVTADRLLLHFKKIGVTNCDQDSVNDTMCILQCKGAIDYIFTLDFE